VTASTLFTLLLGLPVILLTLIIGGAIGKFALGASAVVALIVWQLQETTRRGLWAHFRHKDSIAGDAISYLGQAVGIWILARTGHLSLVTIFGVMTLTSLLAAIVQAMQIGVHWIGLRDLPQIMREFWKTGRWVALTNASVIVGSFCGSWALWLSHGREQVADFFAIANLMKLANPVLTSIGGLITPASAKRYSEAGIYAARKTAAKYALLGAALLAPYFLFILLFPGFVMGLMYGAGKFAGQENSLRGCAIGYIMIFVIGAMTAFLNGVHKARFSFYGQLAAAILQFIILLPLNLAFGVPGYVWGGVLQAFLQMLLIVYLIERAMKEPATLEPTPRGFEPVTS
jgi:O-antigen/teichoic acid export membrane protein